MERRPTNDGRTRIWLVGSGVLSLCTLSLTTNPTKCGLGEERPLAASSSQHFYQFLTFYKVAKVAGLL